MECAIFIILYHSGVSVKHGGSLVPRRSRGEKAPGIHCLRMRIIIGRIDLNLYVGGNLTDATYDVTITV